MPSPDDDLVSPGAHISDDTHVGTDFDRIPAELRHGVHASPANPDALVERGLVGDGTEME